ncbi:hypothetical protein CW304_13375 [Bacillus sp. UFRGS-B20]|nr:hypothetical protein CW304_13375 [Bacillus sp. UFRGS-B20]
MFPHSKRFFINFYEVHTHLARYHIDSFPYIGFQALYLLIRVSIISSAAYSTKQILLVITAYIFHLFPLNLFTTNNAIRVTSKSRAILFLRLLA